jgi:hypothetical protein
MTRQKFLASCKQPLLNAPTQWAKVKSINKNQKQIEVIKMDKPIAFSFSYFASVLATLTFFVLGSLLNVLNKHSVRDYLGVYSRTEIGGLKVPKLLIDTGKINRGIVSRDEAGHVSKEIIQKNFTFERETHVGLTAKASGNLNLAAKEEKIAYIIVQIFINGVVMAVDSMELNNGVLTRLAASTTEKTKLQPGTYEIKVVSVFYGPVQDIHTSLNYRNFSENPMALRKFQDR